MLYFSMLEIGSQIYLRRLEKGMTQAELARRAGIPQPNLSNIEKGKRDLTISTLARIAHALGVNVRDFFAREEKRLSLSISRGRALKSRRRQLQAESLFWEIPKNGKS